MSEIKVFCSYTAMCDVEKFVENPRNDNRHKDEHVDLLAKVFKARGIRHPIIVSNRSGFIVAGHLRLLAAKKLGIEKYPVDMQDFENEAEEYQFLSSDNNVARYAEFDDHKFIENLKELKFDLNEIDFEELGLLDFEIPEVEQCESMGDEDSVPEIPKDATTKLGDVWLLGNHRVMCGDSTMIDSVDKLMNGEKADMVFTDPPYGAGFNIKNDKPDEFEDVFKNSMSNCSVHCDSTFLICCYYSCIAEFIVHMRSLSYIFNEKVVWVKNLFGQGKVFHRKHEDILFFSRANHSKSFRNKHDDAIEFDSVRNFMGSKNAVEAVGHPTQKPVELIEYVMKPFLSKTKRVLDPFLGSGSTLIACEKTKRKCYGMELDPKYCDVIVKRWQEYTGKNATLEITGEKFDDLVID